MSDIVDLILQTLGKEHSSDLGITAEREKQYDNLFPKQKSLRDDLNAKKASDLVIDIYYKKILKGNPWLQDINEDFELRGIDTIRESTKSIAIDNDKTLIVLDSHTQRFLWTMNKASLYGTFHLSVEENLTLFAELFIHFSTLIISNSTVSTPKPKTPSHKNKNEFYLLGLYTEIQEVFLLSHEIAHKLLKDPEYHKKFDLISPQRDKFIDSMYDIDLSVVEEEILADEIAFEMTLNVYGREDPLSVEVTTTAIFVMIRYFLWLRVVYKKKDEDYEFGLWMARNSFIREKINQVYKWKAPVYIISVLESMEERMEPAALIAQDILKKYKDDIS